MKLIKKFLGSKFNFHQFVYLSGYSGLVLPKSVRRIIGKSELHRAWVLGSKGLWPGAIDERIDLQDSIDRDVRYLDEMRDIEMCAYLYVQTNDPMYQKLYVEDDWRRVVWLGSVKSELITKQIDSERIYHL